MGQPTEQYILAVWDATTKAPIGNATVNFNATSSFGLYASLSPVSLSSPNYLATLPTFNAFTHTSTPGVLSPNKYISTLSLQNTGNLPNNPLSYVSAAAQISCQGYVTQKISLPNIGDGNYTVINVYMVPTAAGSYGYTPNGTTGYTLKAYVATAGNSPIANASVTLVFENTTTVFHTDTNGNVTIPGTFSQQLPAQLIVEANGYTPQVKNTTVGDASRLVSFLLHAGAQETGNPQVATEPGDTAAPAPGPGNSTTTAPVTTTGINYVDLIIFIVVLLLLYHVFKNRGAAAA